VGALGMRQASEEELYFRCASCKEQELLADLRVHHQEEIDRHKKRKDQKTKKISILLHHS
uniref:Uncharacterized protein n=1 Tax=Gouania willdenowi TaxID=441366 RepID=A0A8C5GV21_GOUWI